MKKTQYIALGSLLAGILVVLVCMNYSTDAVASTMEDSSIDGDEDADFQDIAGGRQQQPTLPDDMWKAIMFRGNQKQNMDAPGQAPDIPLGDCYGEFRVKMKKGFRLERKNSVSRVYDEQMEKPVSNQTLKDLDYQFPEMTIELLWGEQNRDKLTYLKQRGEELSGRTLPDLTAWYRVIPDPSLYRMPIISSASDSKGKYSSGDLERLRKARRLLGNLPGVETAHAMAPLILSSSYHPYQYQLGPDHYDGSGGDYDLEPLIDEGAACDNENCNLGGLNILPAWDVDGDIDAEEEGIKGANVPIGYVEGAWCLIPDGDDDEEIEIDMDTDIAGLYNINNPCGQHPDLSDTQFGYVTNNNLKGYGYGLFSSLQAHGTAVLGIMAAAENAIGVTGISPESTYYLGQVLRTAEWIDILNKLIHDKDGNGMGAIFLLEFPVFCDPSLTSNAPCPAEVWPEIHDFIQTATWNNIVVVNIPGNGIVVENPYAPLFPIAPGVNLDVPQLYVVDGGDYDFLEAGDMDDPFFEFDYDDTDIEFSEHDTIWPASMKTLNRASQQYEDSGAIIVTAGYPVDVNLAAMPGGIYPNRSRDTWSAYGSRVDINARGQWNYTTTANESANPPSFTYNWFPGTSACGPQVAGVSALIQQSYKLVRPGDVLNGIRMRNAIVENGNAQIIHSEDPNRTLGALMGSSATGFVPLELETPHEPFARIGPRPDMGRVLDAFGITSPTNMTVSFNDHQYRYVEYSSPALYPYSQSYYPNEPYAMNYFYRYNPSAQDDWSVRHIRSPRIDGGHALHMTPYPLNPSVYLYHYLVQYTPDADAIAYLHPTNGKNFTISAWVNLEEITGYYQGLFVKEQLSPGWLREYGLYVNPSGRLHFHCHSAANNHPVMAANGSAALSAGRVYHIAAVFSDVGVNQRVTFYIDGAEDSWTEFGGDYGCAQVPSAPWSGNGYYGSMDEIRYENTAVSGNELQERYEHGANPPGLIADWRFDRKGESTIYDPVNRYDGDLSASSVADFYSEWGPGRPIGHFDGTATVSIDDPDNSGSPPPAVDAIDDEFSVEVHLRTPASTALNYIVSHGYGYGTDTWRMYWNSGRIYFKICPYTSQVPCSYRYTSELSQDRWYHIVGTYDVHASLGQRINLYVDGVKETLTGAEYDYAYSPAAQVPVLIGAAYSLSSGKYNGEIDYLRIYNKALNATGVYNDSAWQNTNRNDITWLFDRRAAIWQNSYYGWYSDNWYDDE